METKSGLAFVISHLNVIGELPVPLIPNHCFRAASDSEIEHIRGLLGSSIPLHTSGFWPRYESVVHEERYEGSASYIFDDLPRADWKYWVVAFEGNNVRVHDLQTPLLLLEPEVEFGFNLYFSEPAQKGERVGWSMIPLHLVERYTKPEVVYSNARTIQVSELEKVRELYELCNAIPAEFTFLEHALKNFESIRLIPERSELLAVAYFSIVEALVTHPPRLAETLDSISHQIRTKLTLLNKRFETRLAYTEYFLPAAEDTIWGRLYSYRSALAHGTNPKFDSELQVLKDHASVVRFLRRVVKQLLLLGLRDPEFLSDLKQC